MWERRPRDCLVCLVLSQDHLSLFLHFISLCLTYQIHQPHWQIHRPIYKIRHSQIHRHKGVFGFESQPVAATLIPTYLPVFLSYPATWMDPFSLNLSIHSTKSYVCLLSFLYLCKWVFMYLCFCTWVYHMQLPGLTLSFRTVLCQYLSCVSCICVNVFLCFCVCQPLQ